MSVTLHRKTNGGVPVRIVINWNNIEAYREAPVEIVAHEYKDGKETVSVEPELSRYFSESNVMEIRRHGEDDYTVDFDAGFQRGRVSVGQKALTTHNSWPSPGAGFLKWIGLSYKDPEVRKFLRGEDQ